MTSRSPGPVRKSHRVSAHSEPPRSPVSDSDVSPLPVPSLSLFRVPGTDRGPRDRKRVVGSEIHPPVSGEGDTP